MAEFIAAEDWPPGSPDLNPLIYHLWNILEENACCTEALKVDLVKSAASIALDVVHVVIDEWPGCLRKFVKAKGAHFEYLDFFYSVLSLINIFCSRNWLLIHFLYP